MGAFGLLGDIGMGALHGIQGLLGSGAPQVPTQTAPQQQDIDLFGASAALPYGGQVQPVAAPQAPQEGFLSKAGHFLFGGGQGNPNDPLGRFRPGLVQEALGTVLDGGNPWAARDVLTQRNIAQANMGRQQQFVQALYARDPAEAQAYMMDPKGYLDARYGAYTLKPGEVHYLGNRPITDAPTVLSEGQTLTGTVNGAPIATGVITAEPGKRVYKPNAALPGAPPQPVSGPVVPTRAPMAAGGASSEGPTGSDQAAASGSSSPSTRFQNFATNYLFPAEGGYTANDGNGAPANFGINQAANPDVNVKTLTQADAAKIYHDRYWVPSGADNLPPGLGEVQADTAINMGLPAAQHLLAQSGGNVNRYLALREQAYRAMAQHKPSIAARLPGLLNRNQQLGQYAARASQASQQQPQPQDGQQAPANAQSDATQGQSSQGSGLLQDASMPRQLVTPQERAAHGISPADRSGYALKPDGTIEKTADDPFGPSQQMEYTGKFLANEPVKNYLTTRGFLDAAKQSMAQKGGYADLNLIDMAGKSVNPTLAMRPNMVEQFGKERGWSDALIGKVRATLEHGQQLDDEARNALYNTIYTNTMAHYKAALPFIRKAQKDAQKYGLQFDELVPEFPEMPAAPAAPYSGSAGASDQSATKVRTYNPKTGNLE